MSPPDRPEEPGERRPDPRGIPGQKFGGGQQVMRERGGLRRLRVGMGRHHCFQVPRGEFEPAGEGIAADDGGSQRTLFHFVGWAYSPTVWPPGDG